MRLTILGVLAVLIAAPVAAPAFAQGYGDPVVGSAERGAAGAQGAAYANGDAARGDRARARFYARRGNYGAASHFARAAQYHQYRNIEAQRAFRRDSKIANRRRVHDYYGY